MSLWAEGVPGADLLGGVFVQPRIASRSFDGDGIDDATGERAGAEDGGINGDGVCQCNQFCAAASVGAGERHGAACGFLPGAAEKNSLDAVDGAGESSSDRSVGSAGVSICGDGGVGGFG